MFLFGPWIKEPEYVSLQKKQKTGYFDIRSAITDEHVVRSGKKYADIITAAPDALMCLQSLVNLYYNGHTVQQMDVEMANARNIIETITFQNLVDKCL